MSFSFSSLVRLIVIMVLGTAMLAIGLSRLDPPRPSLRVGMATKYYNINEYFINYAGRTPRWLDSENGQLDSFSLQDGDVLEAASCSPWVDEKGRHQVVGRWSSRTQMGPMSISTDFGLGRYSFPDGQLLDHVSTDIVPVGPPCWFPGLRARVLFGGGDGQLYHYAFEPESDLKAGQSVPRPDIKPTPLKWRCPKPGLGKVFLSDPIWPEDPKMSGYVIAALREQTSASHASRTFTRSKLWWLKLNFAGTEIVEAGVLLQPDGEPKLCNSLDHRLPTIGSMPGGKLALAYLAEGNQHQSWELRVAPIEFDGDHHVPKAMESNSVILSTKCEPSLPAFSADGRWLNAIAQTNASNGKLVRFPMVKFFTTAM